MQRLFFPLLCLAFLILSWSGAHADKLPPPKAKPLSSILMAVENQNIGQIIEAEFDDGLWEVKTCQVQNYQKIYLDPVTGQEQRPRKSKNKVPPANALPLSSIVQTIEDRKLGSIIEVEFDDELWKIKLRKDGREIKMSVNPMTGQSW